MPQETLTMAMAAKPDHIGCIEVLSGMLAGLERRFGDDFTIGRRTDNDLSLNDDQVSRVHARIRREDDAFVIEDLGSRLGTRVDGVQVADRAALKDGCHIAVGKTVLRFRAREEKKAALSAEQPPKTLHAIVPLPRTTQSEISTMDLRVVSLDRGVASDDLDHKDPAGLLTAGKHLQTLLLANRIISTELDTEALLEKILDALFETFSVHRAVVLTLDGEGSLAVRATRSNKATDEAPRISSTIAYRALEHRVGVLTLDAGADDRFDAKLSIVAQDIRSVIAAPMVHADRALGVIYLDTVGIARVFNEGHLELLNGIASAAAGALDRASLVQRLKDTAAETIFRLAVAAEYRDDDTGFHIHRMSDYAAAIAATLGHDDAYCNDLKLASPMHDVGKIGIPDAILKKPGRLTPEEFDIMKSHTTKGGAILGGSESSLLTMAHDVAMAHHERFDGDGYPGRLAGKAIPLEGRIVAVADVFDALASKRCYKPAWDIERCFAVVEESAGSHFDPEVVEAFMASRERILGIRDHYRVLEERAADENEAPSFENLWKRSGAIS